MTNDRITDLEDYSDDDFIDGEVIYRWSQEEMRHSHETERRIRRQCQDEFWQALATGRRHRQHPLGVCSPF
ncbi:hypothetical protein IJJ08_01035 [bacterium]|nr:hypothetical protein [bacterium]